MYQYIKHLDNSFAFKDDSTFRLGCYCVVNVDCITVTVGQVLITHSDHGVTHSLSLSSDGKVLHNLKKSKDAAQLYRLCLWLVATKEKDDY